MPVDFSQFKKFEDNLKKFNDEYQEKFIRDCAKDLARRLLALVIPATPVGVHYGYYNDAEHDSYIAGRSGGTLRRGWVAKTEAEAEDNAKEYPNAKDVSNYVKALPISQNGTNYTITIINPVKYASYVEYGHRQDAGRYVAALGKKLKADWVDGMFMLTTSENQLQTIAPKVLERKLERELRKVFSDD